MYLFFITLISLNVIGVIFETTAKPHGVLTIICEAYMLLEKCFLKNTETSIVSQDSILRSHHMKRTGIGIK